MAAPSERLSVEANAPAAQLRASKEKYRQYIENISDVITVLDTTGIITYESPAIEQLAGYRPEDLVGRNAFELIHPADADAVRALFAEGLKGSARGNLTEFRFRHRNGSWTPFEGSCASLREGDRVVGVVISSRDVTERERADAARREMESRLRLIFEQAAVGLAQIDLHGRFLQVNGRLCDILGYAREELQALSLRQIMPAASWADDEARVNDVAAGRLGVYAVTRLCSRKDGAPIWIDFTISFGRPSADSPQGGVVVLQDVTAAMESKRATHDATDFREAIERSMRAGVVAMNLNARLVYANAAFEQMSGWTSADLIGRDPPYPYWPPETAPERLESVGALVTSGSQVPDVIEGPLMRPNGERFPALMLPSVLRDPEGKTVGFLECVYDLTPTRLLEDQLRQAQKMEAVGRLAGGVAHDFNNMLTAILGYSELILERIPENDPLRPDIEEIRHAGESAAGLTRQLLALSRKQVLKPEVTNLNAVITNMTKLLRRTINEDVKLDTALAPDLATVVIDTGQFEQVLMNLALNSRDAMPHGGVLSVQTANVSLEKPARHGQWLVPPGKYARLSIADTGCGMGADVLAHLFEPFFTTKPRGRGTGLGLPTVYGIVTQSEGHIAIESTVGKGTTVWVYLPVSTLPAAPTPKPEAVEPDAGNATVLLVDDDARVRQLVGTVLLSKGYIVIAAANGAEALQAAAANHGRIDLILTDVVMPGLSGPELVAQMRIAHPHVRYAYMSGYTDESLELHDVKSPTSGSFLQKPFTPATLLQFVREALRRDVGGPVPAAGSP